MPNLQLIITLKLFVTTLRYILQLKEFYSLEVIHQEEQLLPLKLFFILTISYNLQLKGFYSLEVIHQKDQLTLARHSRIN